MSEDSSSGRQRRSVVKEGVADIGALLARIARHDRDAFTVMARQYGPRLRGYLMGRGVAAHLADDAVQETLLAIWRKADQFDGRRGRGDTWLFAVARNSFANLLRKERPLEVPYDPTHPQLVSAVSLDRAEASRDLGQVLPQLPPEQARVLSGVCHGQSLAQIAQEQRLPLGTVKTRRRLALGRLLALLK